MFDFLNINFKDISNFWNINDYLPILNGVLLTDILIMVLLYYTTLINSKVLKSWYREFRLSAVIADVLIIVIGFIIARYIYRYFFKEWALWKFILVILGVQIIHDVLFYLLFTYVPRGQNYMIDFFKSYAKEVSWKAILGDSSMMIISTILASYLANQSINMNIITLIVSVYLIPYIVYTQK